MGEYRWVFIDKHEDYESLLGPNDRTVCTITEPEDRTGRRDLRAVAAELNRLARERDEWKARAEKAAAEERGKLAGYLVARARWLIREHRAGGSASLDTRARECCEAMAELIGKGRHEDPRHVGDPTEVANGSLW